MTLKTQATIRDLYRVPGKASGPPTRAASSRTRRSRRATAASSRPISAAGPSRLAVGGSAVLGLPGMNGVWLCRDGADWDAFLDAENAGARGGPGSRAALTRMAADGRARVYPAAAYAGAFKVCALFVLIATGLTLLLRETRGRNIYHELYPERGSAG